MSGPPARGRDGLEADGEHHDPGSTNGPGRPTSTPASGTGAGPAAGTGTGSGAGPASSPDARAGSNGERRSIGVDRLDELLQGGVPLGSATLVYGPPFAGKRVLTQLFALRALHEGVPVIFVTTDATCAELSRELSRIDPEFPAYERAGLVHFVDTYSRSIGASDELSCAEYVDGPMNLNGVTAALANCQRKLIQDHEHHAIVFDSVSTLMAYTNPQTTFRFLQVLVGKARMAGATLLLTLEKGMHAEAEVQMIMHLTSGVVELRKDGGKHYLSVAGLGTDGSAGWIEYEHGPARIRITGSFAAGRIR